MRRYDFFISHHQKDSGTEASLLAETLRNQGYRVFLDVDTHQVGDLVEVTRAAMEVSRGVLALVGPNFVERVKDERDWVRVELEHARHLGKKTLPIVLPGIKDPLPESSLATSLSWMSSTRRLSFDRSRVAALTAEVREAFSIRPRQEPGMLYVVLMIVLAVTVGMVYIDNHSKSNALEIERIKLEQEKARSARLQTDLDASMQDLHRVRAGPDAAVRNEKLVLVDTADTTKAYSRALHLNAQTNAHFLRKILAEFVATHDISVEMELVAKDQVDVDVVLAHKPKLIVVHRSAFGPEDQDAADAGIVSLIRRLPRNTRILVYSRKVGTNSEYAGRLAGRSDAVGRVYALQLPQGDAWVGYEAVKRVVDEIAGLIDNGG